MKLLGLEVRRVPKVVKRAADEIWVTADGELLRIGDMSESHAKLSLAMIVRAVRDYKPVRMLSNGQLFFGDDQALSDREELLRALDFDFDFDRDHLGGNN